MARRVFSTGQILDAARALIVTGGVRAATVEAIARRAGVPVGSIYHRFESIDELLAAVWMRAVRRSQEAAAAVPVEAGRALENAERVALAMYDHCLEHPEDALLLDVLSHADLLRLDVGTAREPLRTVNQSIEALMAGLATELFGRAGAAERDLVLLALVDLPHGFVSRQLAGGTVAPQRRERLVAAVRAVLAPL